MSFLKLPAVIFAVCASVFSLAIEYTNSNTSARVGLFGTVVANLALLLDHYRQYRKAKLFRAEIEKNAALISNWLVDNSAEFEQNGVGEYPLARAIKISVEQATTAIDRLESREAVVRDPVALTDPPRFQVKPGRNWRPIRDKLVASRMPGPPRHQALGNSVR